MVASPSTFLRASTFVALAACVAPITACGDDSATGAGGGGGNEATGTTSADAATTSDGATTTDAATSTDAASTGTGGACSPDPEDACEVCTAETCCDAWTACEADQGCWDCVTGADDSLCAAPGTHDRVTEYLECVGGPCVEACIGVSGDCQDAEPTTIWGDTCGGCLEENCCAEVGACYEHGEPDEGCWYDCVTNHNAAGCHEPTAHALFYAIGECAQTACQAECFEEPAEPACEGVPEVAPSAGSCVDAGSACNPVTNDGCDAEAGEACDRNADGDYQCFPAPNEEALCEACDNANGPFCQAGHACGGGICLRYCCTDADCGDEGVCSGEGNIGYCIAAE